MDDKQSRSEEQMLHVFRAAYDHLNGKNIYEVRNIARAYGINAPTLSRKHALIVRVIGVASGVNDPEHRSGRGARVKANDASEESIAAFQEIVEICKQSMPYAGERIEPDKHTFEDAAGVPVQYGYRDVFVSGYLEKCGKEKWCVLSKESEKGKQRFAIGENLVREYDLREGDLIGGYLSKETGNGAEIVQIAAIEGKPPVFLERKRFEDYVAAFPSERFALSGASNPVVRASDILCPIGKGQRMALVAPSGTGVTTYFREVAVGIGRQAQVLFLLLGQRPEESGAIRALLPDSAIFSAPFDTTFQERMQCARLAIERAKRKAESGEDAVLLLDSGTALIQAAEKTAPDREEALLECKRMFASARKLEGGGSLTILAAFADKEQWRMEYGEFVDAANAVLYFSREDAEAGIIPAIDFRRSFNKHSEGLLNGGERERMNRVRGGAAGGTKEILERMEKE